jgi:hypothetical protein
MKLGRILCVLVAAGASCGCVSAPESATSTEPTLVAVSPGDFLGDVPCANAPGAMRTYVATVTDVTPGVTADGSAVSEFALPSSGPVSCLKDVGFGGGFVIPGHEYVADVEAYDRTGLEQLGGTGSGSPMLVDKKTGAFVPPRWTTSCGRGAPLLGSGPAEAGLSDAAADASDSDADAADAEAGPNAESNGPVVAASNETVFVRGCAPLTDHATAGPTAITVALGKMTLGSLSCGLGVDQVDHFTAELEGAGGSVQSGTCRSKLEFSGLTAGQSYDFHVEAYAAGATSPGWATDCYASALSGAVIGAACDPLTDQGAISVDMPDVLKTLGLSCGAQLLSVTVTLAGVPSVTQTPPQCDQPVQFSGLAPGSYAIAVTTTLSDGSGGPTASCTSTVLPGRTTQALCSKD